MGLERQLEGPHRGSAKCGVGVSVGWGVIGRRVEHDISFWRLPLVAVGRM